MESAVIVGVVGHRVLADTDRLVPAIRAAYAAIHVDYPGRAIRLQSALAEGADRLVRQALLDSAEVTLDVVLPLPIEQYTTDFPSAASHIEFDALLSRAEQLTSLSPGPTREASYISAANYILDRSDVPIGLWDGHPGQGRGGTGETIAEACRRCLKLAWIHAGDRRLVDMQPTSLGGDQGRLSLKDF